MSRCFLVSFWIIIGSCLSGCSNSSSKPVTSPRGEYIFRHHDESFVQVAPMEPVKRNAYPWEEGGQSRFPKITKDYFRCQGSSLNPVNLVQRGKETVPYYDCGGAQKHSLPLRDQKEFIYPILIDLLNYIQTKTGKKVVITCGHCCPDHNTYINPSPSNLSSKHMIGAEVDFYVQGMEQQPEEIVSLILGYYQQEPKYKGLNAFEEFKRCEKGEKNQYVLPWINKEIFVKLLRKEECRDFDNRHPHPYISIQVRYDWDKKENVSYSWDKAFRNYQRW